MTPLAGQCLCGAISVSHSAPEILVRCNCSACRRYGAVWAHGPLDTIAVTQSGPVIRYVRDDSDGDIAFVSCATCGVTTHWEPADPTTGPQKMAMNAALCPAKQTSSLRLRHFDGADTWCFLD